jgi:regulator of sirC expression with transglutaminase-like and TPR domain
LVLSVIFSVLAMFTKEISFTLPVMVVLLELSFFRGSPRKRFFLLSPLLLTMLIIPYNVIGVEKPLGGLLSDAGVASGVQTAVSRWDYLVTQCVVIVTYIRLLLVPINQNLDYDFPLYHSLACPAVLFTSFFLLSLICVGCYLFYRSRCSARALRLVAFGIFWFFIALSVESSVIPIADVIFEHRVYLPSVGAFLAFSAAAGLGAERLAVRHRLGWKAAASVLGGIVLIFSVVTIQRNRVWHDEETLWSDVVRKSPNKARGFNNLALALLKKGQLEKACALFDRAITLDPRYAEAYNNRGNLSEKINQNEKAIEGYSRAIEINPYDADYYYNRGYVRSKEKEYEAAIRDFSRAIELDPRHDKAYVQRGFASYLLLNNANQALPDFLKACQLGNSVGCEVFKNSFTGGDER